MSEKTIFLSPPIKNNKKIRIYCICFWLFILWQFHKLYPDHTQLPLARAPDPTFFSHRPSCLYGFWSFSQSDWATGVCMSEAGSPAITILNFLSQKPSVAYSSSARYAASCSSLCWNINWLDPAWMMTIAAVTSRVQWPDPVLREQLTDLLTILLLFHCFHPLHNVPWALARLMEMSSVGLSSQHLASCKSALMRPPQKASLVWGVVLIDRYTHKHLVGNFRSCPFHKTSI